MKRAVIRNLKGEVVDVHESTDPTLWIIDGMQHKKWGNQGDYVISVNDIERIKNDSAANRVKRETLLRDFDALTPHRKAKLKDRIYKWVLLNSDMNVEDI